jgi:muramoyltetrapeptide carboxypeptidase LdcA involved in peptidoglycan recycling
MEFKKLPKLNKGDKVAIVSPSFGAPGVWPHVYELGLKRLKEVFGLEPVEFTVTKKVGASKEERAKDLIDAFENKEIKAVISSLGGDDQVTYIKNLPSAPFANNPKPFFGFSDNTHFENFLWQNGIPSFYGGALFTEFAMQQQMDELTVEYLNHALFDEGEFELKASPYYNDIGLNWNEPETINLPRVREDNDPWFWDKPSDAQGISWGGCIESIDEIMRHSVALPNLEDLDNAILFLESSEEIPSAQYVSRVLRALGERGILERVKAVLVGRPKAWHFNNQKTAEEKKLFREEQREIIIKMVRNYNQNIPIVQNLDFGHTAPQICMPNGQNIRIDGINKKIFAQF